MGTHLRVLSESFPMNTNMTGLILFSKLLHFSSLNESSLGMKRVKIRPFTLKVPSRVERPKYKHGSLRLFIDSAGDRVENFHDLIQLWLTLECELTLFI